MSIIFKVLKYLRAHKKTVIAIVMLASIVVSITSLISARHYKSLYKAEKQISQENQEKVTEFESTYQPMVDENELLTKTIRDLQTQIAEVTQQNESLQSEVNALTIRNENLAAQKSQEVTITGSKDTGYSQATVIWNKLKSVGLNDYVCSGIIGNIMSEVGGQTLDISKWPQYSKNNYYGICQWSGTRKTRLLNNFGTSLEAQANFLVTELFEVIPKNNSFYNMQDEKEAALYFAKYYERCSSKYYSVRQNNATKALNYFTGK